MSLVARRGLCCKIIESESHCELTVKVNLTVNSLWAFFCYLFDRDVSRSTGLDAQTLRELKLVLETKKQRMEGGAGEEELGKVDGEMHRILKSDERPVHDRNSVLLTPTADYTIALRMIESAQRRAKEASGKASGGGGGSGGAGRKSQFDQRPGAVGSGASSSAAADSSRLHPPIIIVPSDPSAMVNMTNIVDFLEKAHFVSTSFVLF